MLELADIQARLARLGRDPGGEPDGNPAAAVAAILRPGAGGAELFFIRRAQRAGDPWSGHIAFPGGRRDGRDATLLDTALRETREEVGIELRPGELVARLPDVPAFSRSRRGTLVVTPFVFAVHRELSLSPNQEVAEALWVPFDRIARGEGKTTFLWTWQGQQLELPCIHLGGLTGSGPVPSSAIEAGQPILWGMTYRMIETLLEALLPPPPSGDLP